MVMNPVEANKIWSAFGLNPQAFPIYYPMGPQPFLDGGGNPSGAEGAIARLSHSLPNFPHLFFGIRLSNVFPIPAGISADDLQLYRAMKEWVDGEQTVRTELAQQSVVIERVLQKQLTGLDGVHWHPFPVPFPMAGGNDINVEVRRSTSYLALAGQDTNPVCHATIVAAVMRADMQTMAPHRVHGGQ